MEKEKRTMCIKVDEWDCQHVKKFDIGDLMRLLVENWTLRDKLPGWSKRDSRAWIPDDRVYFEIMGVDEPEGLPDSNTGKPKFELFDFKDRLFAIKWINGQDVPGAPLNTGWEILYRTTAAASLVNVEFNTLGSVKFNRTTGQLMLYRSCKHVFNPSDGIWPWPAVFPGQFLLWSRLASLAQPNDANPLTGLLANKKDPPARTLAVQIVGELNSILDDWGMEIVESL